MAKGVNRFINVYINGKQVENNINSIKSAITKLTNEQKKMTIGSEEVHRIDWLVGLPPIKTVCFSEL